MYQWSVFASAATAMQTAMPTVIYANLLRVLTNIAILVTSKDLVRDHRIVPNGRQDLPSPS